MADDFDPYYTWLGIPPEDQPADLYRLLGVRRYEVNGDVITNAMDQRMHYLRSLQVGKRSALSQKILNEVSAAGVVLLDPKKRSDYDQQLRAKEAKEAKAASAAGSSAPVTSAATVVPTKTARPLPMAASLPKAAPLPAPVASQPGVIVASSGRNARPGGKGSIWMSPAVLGGVAFAAVAVLGLIGMIVVRSMQTPEVPIVDKHQPTLITDKGNGKVKPKVQIDNGDGKGSTNPKINKQPSVVPPVSPTAGLLAWWDDADSRRLLNVLEFDKRGSVEIEQTANWVPLTQNTTIEGWFKLQLDSPQTMSLLGTRSGGTSGTPPKGWMLMARRGVENGKMADVLVLEVWKDRGQFVHYKTALPQPSQWHHLALVSAGKEWLIFVDGKEALRDAAEAGLTGSGANLRLGDDGNGRGSGMEGQVCGLRISDTARYQKPFTPPPPLAMTHDQPTAASLHFTMAVPSAAAGTIRRSVPHWKYGHGHYDAASKKIEAFTPMLEWNGLQWKPGPGLPPQIAQWMSLDPLGGHAGNGPQFGVIRRWTAPDDGTLAIAGRLTHAHETQFGDGIHGRIVSSAAGEVGQWDSRFTTVETAVGKLAVKKGETVDFLVECNKDNHCDKFAWQVQLTLIGADGKTLGMWDSEKNYHGPSYAGAVYQLASLAGARWQRLDPGSAVAMMQLAPIAPIAAVAPTAQGRVNLIDASFDGRQNIRGQVQLDGSSLRTGNLPTAFMLPADFPEEYVLEADVVRESGEDSICIGIPLPGGRKMTAIVDGQRGTKSGLSSVNSQQIFTPGNPLVRAGRLLTNGQPATVRISVQKAAVELLVDGTSISKWEVSESDTVASAKGMGYTDPRAVAIFTWNSPIRIDRLEMIPANAANSATPPSTAASGRIELVQTHGKRMQLVSGTLTYSERAGLITGSTPSAFMFPEKMPSEYVLEAELVREEGTGSISFHLPVRGKALSAIIDIYDSRLTGLSDINDWNIQSANNPTVHRGPVLTNGKPAQVRIVVNQQEISLSVDGKKLSSWPYDPAARLVGYQGLRLPDLSKVGITTGNSKFRIQRLELFPGASTPGPVNPLTVASAIDLIDAGRRTVRGIEGSHQVSGNVLTTGEGKSRVVVDHDLPDEYTLEAEVTRLAGNDTLGIGFPVQGRPLCVLIDGWNSDRSGICMIPGQDASDPGGPTIQKGQLLTNGRPARLRVVVNRQEVLLDIDDNTVARWKNDPAAALQAFKDYEPDGKKLSITSFSVYRIANLKLIPASTGSSAPVSPPPMGFAGVKKAPIPDAAAKAKAQTQIAAVFGDELKSAKTPQAKGTVAKKISDLARETKDLATKYVMLEEARRLFVELKEVVPALQTADAVSQDFDVPPLPVKVKLLETMAEGSLSAAQREQLVAEACGLGYEAIDSDQFDVAQAMAAVARTAASRSTSADVKAEAKEFTDEFALRHKRWDAVRKAEKTLADAPEDPAANLALGLYHFFDRSDQAKGLAMLIKGSDAKLAAAAKARRDSVSKGLGSSLAEADAWFDAIPSVSADYKAAMQKRALDAYELAMTSIEGIDKAKAVKRRDQLRADLASNSASPAGSKRGTRIRKSDLPESSPGMVGRVYLAGKDAGLLITFNASQRSMDTQKLRSLLTQNKVAGGRIVLEGVLTCPTPMSMRVSHRGASTVATQQMLVNGKVLTTVGGNRGSYDNEQLQLAAGNHLVQWVIEFDGSIGPSIHIYEDGSGRTVPLTFNRDQSYGARKLTTIGEMDLTDSSVGP